MFREKQIRIAREKFPQYLFYRRDASFTGLESGDFDTVIAVVVLEHLLDPDSAIKEAARLLGAGGYLIAITTDFNWIKRVAISAFCWDRYFDWRSPHIRHFTKKGLGAVCRAHEFIPVKYEWDYSYFGIMPMGQRAVFKKL